MNTAILFLALIIDRVVGDPDWLWRRLKHPVVVFGAAIGFADRHLNRDGDPGGRRRYLGVASIAGLVVLCLIAGMGLNAFLYLSGWPGLIFEAFVVAVLLAQKSLADHVAAVARALETEGLPGGRKAVSMIVGRDPEQLDKDGVCRAAIESLAENFSDGIVAPAFWYVVGGLPGLFAYKMVNTADSMIGHMSPRHRDFGWAAARLDDLMNWPAARLSALLLVLGTWWKLGRAMARTAMAVTLRDAGLHRSPNAGWPESAMAGALGLALGGPRRYGDVALDAPFLGGDGRHSATSQDIANSLSIYEAACSILTLLVLATALIWAAFRACA